MTVLDPAFDGVGQEAGIVIWRIEQMEVKPVPVSQYGSFYSGDSYIVLHTKQTKGGSVEWNIHFWLGKDTSQDEAGAAAIKSVELDDVLGGSPVQHREVQEHESNLFLSYFKKGIRYLEGGVASGFHHVEDETVKRLLRVKGRRNVRIHEVPLSADSMNKGDCFILDSGPNVYIWTGENSGRMERIKAIQAANTIRDDLHGGRSVVKIIDAASSGGEVQEFFDELGGGSSADIKDADSGGDDTTFERSVETEVSLHKICDDSGSVQIEKIAEKPLKQEYLESSDCFLLDGGVNGLFVWIGRAASKKERVEAMNYANKYIEQHGYPNWVHVKRIIDQAEPPIFKQYFSLWKEPEDQVGLGRVYTEEQIASSGFEITSLHRGKRVLLCKSAGRACGFMPDDGSGNVEIWRIENFDMVPIDPAAYGVFFGGDSYLVKYTYEKHGSERYIIYFWQGQSSSQDEKAASAILAVKMDNDLGGKAVQVRVVHGQEPEHFLRIFKGKMVIFMGGHASGFKNIHDHDSYDVDGTRMFHVRGTNEFNVRAEQVPEVAASLNSGDVFVLETPKMTYIWIGKESNEEEQDMGKNIVAVVSPGREVIEVKEEEEPDEFWESIGGKGDYEKTRDLPNKPLLESRLFKCSSDSGKFTVDEICNFIQEDLSEDDVMVLDTGDEVFIWVGNGASDDEKSGALKMAEEYIRTDPTDRNLDNTLILVVKQGEEPDSFKSFFNSWDPELWAGLCTTLP